MKESDEVESSGPKVSVCVISYNHVKYIRRCLQSLVNQETDFNFDVIIRDDYSTDGTREIICEFSEKYPNIIKAILPTKNDGGTKNYLIVHQAASGQYIAHMDGDDFALPGKLAAQSRYLDLNPNCIAVVHRLTLVNGEGNPLNQSWPKFFSYDKYNLIRLVRTHPEFGHSSLMYRNGSYANWLQESEQADLVDLFFYVHLAAKGLIGVIDKPLGFYTMGVGISTKANLYKLVIEALNYSKTLGVPEEDYRFACARQFMIFAGKALLEQEVETFKFLIEKSCQYKLISLKQIFLYFTRNNPMILRWVVFLYLRGKLLTTTAA